MGNADAIEIFQSLRGLAQREAEVDMQSKAQRHDMGVKLAEPQGRSILWERI